MFKIEDHEKHINDLSQFLKIDGIDQAKVSTILQALRDNYTEVNTSISDSSLQIQSVNELNEGLRIANMGLLSKLGTQLKDLGAKETNKDQDNSKDEDVISLDDLANEFLK